MVWPLSWISEPIICYNKVKAEETRGRAFYAEVNLCDKQLRKIQSRGYRLSRSDTASCWATSRRHGNKIKLGNKAITKALIKIIRSLLVTKLQVTKNQDAKLYLDKIKQHIRALNLGKDNQINLGIQCDSKAYENKSDKKRAYLSGRGPVMQL